MHVERIFTSAAPGSPQSAHERIAVRAGAGIVGDRNFGLSRHPGQNLTLVEAEEIEAFCAAQGRPVDLSLTRRNLVTRGVRLNELVGARFKVGDVVMLGIELCEPCTTLGGILASETLSVAAAIKLWVRRGGLRVDVLGDGEIAIGDRVERAP